MTSFKNAILQYMEVYYWFAWLIMKICDQLTHIVLYQLISQIIPINVYTKFS